MPKPLTHSEEIWVEKVWIGIDPGKAGGISTLSQLTTNKIVLEVHPTPASLDEVWRLLVDLRSGEYKACLEWINHAIFGINKSSMSKLYGSFCELRALLTAADIPFEEVKPAKWQSTLGIQPKKKSEDENQWKKRLRDKAKQLFPRQRLWNKTQEYQLKVADSILLAEYCRRELG